MRQRLFWAISGVAALTGVLVLAGSLYASQRAAVDATYRELSQSADEAVSIIQESLAASPGTGAVVEFLRLLEGDQLGRLFARLARAAGDSEIGFAVVTQDGTVRSNSEIFDRVELNSETLEEGITQTTTSNNDELVVVAPTGVQLVNTSATVYVALARAAPVVTIRDQLGGLLLLTAGIVVLAALLARILAAQITRRLEPLVVASQQVAAGDMAARVPDLADPELNEVATAFNEMTSELGEAREREREFILGVGHDLRTPLTTIGGYAEALEAGELGEDDLKRIGGILGVQSRQLGRLIDDLSMLARLEGAEFGLRYEEVDVSAHVTEVVEGFRRRADEIGVSLTVEGDEGTGMSTDPDRIAQIAQNLVENALRHTPEAGKVEVVVSSQPEAVTIAVIDSGSGITPDEMPLVFDRHFVGRQRSVRNEGSGLGLSIVKGLVDRMGGTVEASSKPGAGTTITVRLPRS